MIVLTLPYPISSNRYWRPVNLGKHISIVPTKEAKQYREQVGWIARGAGAVLWESQGFRWDAGWTVPNAGVERLAAKLGYIADAIYGHPSRSLWMVGVTGTNGKTTTSQWIAQSLDLAGRRCGVIGTLGVGLAGALEPSANTTPDAALFTP